MYVYLISALKKTAIRKVMSPKLKAGWLLSINQWLNQSNLYIGHKSAYGTLKKNYRCFNNTEIYEGQNQGLLTQYYNIKRLNSLYEDS